METKEGEKYRDYCKARTKVNSLVSKAKSEYESPSLGLCQVQDEKQTMHP